MKQTQQIKPTSFEPLSKRVVRGGIWVFALRFTNRGLGFIRTIILARLLAPHDFGLLGVAMLAIATLETFSQPGFGAALIQKKENVESYLDTAWTVSAIRGIVLFSILFFSAPVVAKFFNSPQATLVIRVIAVSTLLSGFRNIGIIFFHKELEFNKQFGYELSATLVDLTVAISLAFILRNVWALVWGGLAANFVRLFMSYILHSYRPRIRVEKEKFQDLFSFGRWVLGSSILVFLVTQGDDIFVGKMLGVTALGLYQMAYLISNLPATEITHVISQVTFPAYSKLQDDSLKLKEGYLETLQFTMFLSIPIAGMIFIFAAEFTKIFLSTKWILIVPVMQILVFWGLIRSIGATTGPLIQASGEPKTLFKYELFQLIFLVVLIYPLGKSFGISGVALSVVAASLIGNFLVLCRVFKIIKCSVWDISQKILFPLISSVITVLLIVMLKLYCIHSLRIMAFSLLILLFGFAYLIVLDLLGKFSNYDMRFLLKKIARSQN